MAAPRNRTTSETPSQFWDLMIKLGAIFAFGLLVACLAIPLRPRLAEYRALDEQGKALETQRVALLAEFQRRDNELQMLDSDPKFVEIKARDTLDMCQPGEVVFRFEDEVAAQ